MSEYICIDIETKGTTNPAVIDRIERGEKGRECPGKPTSANPRNDTIRRYQKAVKIWEKNLGGRIQDQIDLTAKNPLYAEVLCAAVVTDDEAGGVVFSSEDGEKEGIQALFRFIDEFSDENTIYTGYYIKHFDIPALMTRARVHGIKLPKYFPKIYGRSWSRNLKDIRDYIFSNKPNVSMSEAAEAYGITAKQTMWNGQPMTGARVQEAFRDGEIKMIEAYCLSDAMDEWELFKKAIGIKEEKEKSAEEMIREILEGDMTDSQKVIAIKSMII